MWRRSSARPKDGKGSVIRGLVEAEPGIDVKNVGSNPKARAVSGNLQSHLTLALCFFRLCC
jgi:hypothetical protein